MQTPGMRIASQDDAAALARLINAAFAVELFFKRGDRTDAADIARLMAEGEFLVLDAADGSMAATVYVRATAPRGYFGMLSVDPAQQGRGLGLQLIQAAE